ncbi:MAG: hypothetical protein DRP08_03380, partial [Candidatus Aenigmatarchaeota archaeon]
MYTIEIKWIADFGNDNFQETGWRGICRQLPILGSKFEASFKLKDRALLVDFGKVIGIQDHYLGILSFMTDDKVYELGVIRDSGYEISPNVLDFQQFRKRKSASKDTIVLHPMGVPRQAGVPRYK